VAPLPVATQGKPAPAPERPSSLLEHHTHDLWVQARQPLLFPIDRWGHLPLMPQPMTSQSIAAIVRDHLSGRVRARAPLPLRKPGDREDDPHVRLDTEVDLDPHY